MILQAREKVREFSGNMSDFCSAIGRHRSLLYRWAGRKGRLKDKKPLAKTYPTKISGQKRAEVICEYSNNHGLLGGWSIAQNVGRISESKVREILREVRPYFLKYNKELEERIKNNFYEFLKLHVCWSWDVLHLLVGGEKMYLHILREEFSRYILGRLLTASVSFKYVTGLIMETIEKYRVKPLVLKRDNDIELNPVAFSGFLNENEIADMPSPPYYPRYQAHHERGNRDIRECLHQCELDPCIIYGEMLEKIDSSIEFLNCRKPRMIFSGKTSAYMFENSQPVGDIKASDLLAEIKTVENEWSPMFEGKNGLRKLHRFATVEVLKRKKLLTVQIEPWQDFRKNIVYNYKGEAVNQLNMPFVS